MQIIVQTWYYIQFITMRLIGYMIYPTETAFILSYINNLNLLCMQEKNEIPLQFFFKFTPTVFSLIRVMLWNCSLQLNIWTELLVMNVIKSVLYI